MSSINRRLNIRSKRGEGTLSFTRDDDRGTVSVGFEDDYGTDIGFGVTLEDLARLRTWLNTGIAPTRIDLVDPVAPIVDEQGVLTFDPQPRDLRAEVDYTADAWQHWSEHVATNERGFTTDFADHPGCHYCDVLTGRFAAKNHG